MLLAVLNPVNVAVFFGGASSGSSFKEKLIVAFKVVAVAFGILLAFALVGDDVLRLIGVRLFALKIAGGILLFLFGVKSVMSPPEKRQTGNVKLEDLAVFPMAMPILAGPASILATVVLIKRCGDDYMMQGLTIGILGSVLMIAFALLLISPTLIRVLGSNGSEILRRIMGLLLASLAIEMVIDGFSLAGLIRV